MEDNSLVLSYFSLLYLILFSLSSSLLSLLLLVLYLSVLLSVSLHAPSPSATHSFLSLPPPSVIHLPWSCLSARRGRAQTLCVY